MTVTTSPTASGGPASGFLTASGNTGSIATATPTTIFTLSAAGLYNVVSWLASGDGAVYGTSAVIRCTGDITKASITATNGSGVALTVTAGGAVQITQNSGGNQTMQWAYQFIGQ